MSLIEIKNSTETFASIDNPNGKVKLNTKNKLVSDFITVESNIEEWAGDIVLPHLSIGGRIFYDNGDNGATYIFYDATDNIVAYDGTITSLSNATQYSIIGTPTKDRFYVYDTTYNLSAGTWGKFNITTGITADTIGSGKTNTATMMSMNPDGTMWTWLRDTVNANSTGGCNDWYIGSMAEQNKLRTSGLVDWYSSNNIWSSVECGDPYA